MTVYGAGLRLSEACHLKAEHIHRDRMQNLPDQGLPNWALASRRLARAAGDRVNPEPASRTSKECRLGKPKAALANARLFPVAA